LRAELALHNRAPLAGIHSLAVSTPPTLVAFIRPANFSRIAKHISRLQSALPPVNQWEPDWPGSARRRLRTRLLRAATRRCRGPAADRDQVLGRGRDLKAGDVGRQPAG